jgi:hypothetical protein
MNEPERSIVLGTATINGQPVGALRDVRLDHRYLEILLQGHAGICVYAFSSLMFSVESNRRGSDNYVMDGPKLGFYHDTRDPREGPYVNHYINHLDVTVIYKSIDEAHLRICGVADLTKSAIDSYWYKGPTEGKWTFEVAFSHRF